MYKTEYSHATEMTSLDAYIRKIIRESRNGTMPDSEFVAAHKAVHELIEKEDLACRRENESADGQRKLTALYSMR